MSDPYLDKLEAQRARWVHEMPVCPQCRANPDSKTPIVDHIWGHTSPEAPLAKESDADIEYDHDAPATHYAYKQRGMDDAAAMHPSRWKEAKAK